LADEDIDSIESLAFADPVRLLFRTNIEWNVILDLVDQAILVHYVGEKTLLLSVKVSGAIDFASLYMRATEGSPEEQAQARDVILAIGRALEEDAGVALNLGFLLYNDPLVQFLWAHWEAARPWQSDDSDLDDSNPVAGMSQQRPSNPDAVRAAAAIPVPLPPPQHPPS
jgi:hypothetical protein